MCLNLPYFLRYINRFQDAVSANSFFIMPATVADATAVRNGYVFTFLCAMKWSEGVIFCHIVFRFYYFFYITFFFLYHMTENELLLLRFHSLVIDVTMALDTLSLPVLEPLTPGRLLDMTVLALSCLYAGG